MEGENEGSLNNADGVVGCLQDAGNNVARAAYNSLRIMCTTRGNAKVTLPAGCLLLSQRGLAAHNEIVEEERGRACVYALRTRTQHATLVCAGLAMGWNWCHAKELFSTAILM